jgi:hypothetical protein
MPQHQKIETKYHCQADVSCLVSNILVHFITSVFRVLAFQENHRSGLKFFI